MPVDTEAQVVQFIKVVYCYDEPKNLEIYSKQTVSTKDIYETISQYTAVFEKRTPQSFATWCKNKRLPFLNGNEIRKDGIRSRELYIMEDIYYGNFEKHS